MGISSAFRHRYDLGFVELDETEASIRDIWLEVLTEVCERHNWAIHAWCQMTNHYLPVIQTAEGNLSGITGSDTLKQVSAYVFAFAVPELSVIALIWEKGSVPLSYFSPVSIGL